METQMEIKQNDATWKVFCENWRGWVDHVQSWESCGDNTIVVHMKDDGYITAGNDYKFYDNGSETRLHIIHMKEAR